MRTLVQPLRLARADFDGFAAAVPLRSQDELIGVLVAFRSAAKGAFDRDDLEFMELFASIVATSMQNARMLGRSEELGMLTERTRIATEMHDSVGDNLAALLMKAELAQVALDSDPQRARTELDWILSTLRTSIVEMRRILRALKPVDLQKMGLVDAIRKIADDYTHNCGIPVVLQASDGIPSLGQKAEYVLYRAVNESLNNARKHSGASSVKVSLQADSKGLVLTVEDNGCGFSPADADQKRGLGLSGLRDSTEAAGGKLEIVSAPQRGTRVSVRFPVRGAT
jgi:two-component system sensor histidine kinase DegS